MEERRLIWRKKTHYKTTLKILRKVRIKRIQKANGITFNDKKRHTIQSLK